jgi:hypothetical protein
MHILIPTVAPWLKGVSNKSAGAYSSGGYTAGAREELPLTTTHISQQDLNWDSDCLRVPTVHGGIQHAARLSGSKI